MTNQNKKLHCFICGKEYSSSTTMFNSKIKYLGRGFLICRNLKCLQLKKEIDNWQWIK